MIHGVGVDIVAIKRIEDALYRHGDRFLRRILGEGEVGECAAHRTPARFLAKRFAVKEAFAKAFGSGIGAEIGWHDIAVAHHANGRPQLRFSDALQARLRQAGCGAAHLSISDEADYAMAYVVLEKGTT